MATRRKSGPVAITVASDKEWQARDDMRTLVNAREIRDDKARFAAAQRMAAQERAKLSSITRSKSTDKQPRRPKAK